MFSGKTEELIRRLKRAKFARQRVEIFKPAIDTRYSEEEVVSHDSNSIASTPIDSSTCFLDVVFWKNYHNLVITIRLILSANVERI